MNNKNSKFWLIPVLVIGALAHNNDSDTIAHKDDSEFRADSFWSTAQSVAKNENISGFFSNVENHFDQKRMAHMRDVGLTK